MVEKLYTYEIYVVYLSLSLQCGRQIAQLKEEYEETKQTLEAEALKLRQVSIESLQIRVFYPFS